MRKSTRARLALAVLAASLTSSAGCGLVPRGAEGAPPASAPAPAPRRLKVALYPYVPGYEAQKAYVREAFSKERPGTELEFVDLGAYYDPEAEDSILRTDADVLEIDSVFLDDLLPTLRPLPGSVALDPAEFHPAAASVGLREGRWLAAPRWLCAHFLFAPSELAPELRSFGDLERALGSSRGLLVDLEGSSTLGELFLGAQSDALGLPSALASLSPGPAAPSLEGTPGLSALARLRGLCRPEVCRSEAVHADPSELPRRMARRQGAALVGYAEALSAFVAEASAGCGGAPCLEEDALEVLPLALSEQGDRPFVWVDSLAIRASCEEACLDDAAALVALLMRDEAFRALLLPEGEPPRYLLPAKRTLDAELDAKAPYYAKLRPLVAGAPAARGAALGRTLRRVGREVDRALSELERRAPGPGG